jgi:hypothetical protein
MTDLIEAIMREKTDLEKKMTAAADNIQIAAMGFSEYLNNEYKEKLKQAAIEYSKAYDAVQLIKVK